MITFNLIRIILESHWRKRELIASLLTDPAWECKPIRGKRHDCAGEPCCLVEGGILTRGKVKVWCWEPWFFGLGGAVRVTVDDCPVWFPWFCRCCIRRAVRIRMLKKLEIELGSCCPEPCCEEKENG